MTRLRLFQSLFLMVFIFSSCAPYETSSRERAEKAEKAEGDIVIGIAWNTSAHEDLFVEGVTMAVDELNAKGGVLGRKVRTIIYDDHASVEQGQKVAKKLAANLNVVAVTGHANSDAAIPASITYQYNGIVFVSPTATSPKLTKYGFPYVFRNIPSDEEVGRHLAKCAYDQGLRKIVILDDRTEYGKGLASIFGKECAELGIQMVFHRSYHSWWTDFRRLIAEIKESEFDAVLLSAQLPLAAKVIKQFREMGVTAPFIGGDSLDSTELWDLTDGAAEGTIVATVFNPHLPHGPTQQFKEDFFSKFETYPDTWAAQGYDAIKLLAFTFEKCASTVPIVVSAFLRYVKDWHGVAGTYSFTQNGDVLGRPIHFKILHDGKFQYL
ncbi:MAG: ABC transporter substrate-binding protein [Thermodesulfobacteriota bacterium]|nr:ABC transporter substrate-binding protein [Thermodesulfobacteriota bacterium]